MSDHSTAELLRASAIEAEVLGARGRARRRVARPDTADERWARRFQLGLGVLLAAGLAVWLSRLTSSSLFTDEALSWHEANSGLHTLMTLVRHAELNPPGYPLFLHLWIKLVPSSEWWLRLPSVIAGVGSVAAVAWLTSLVAGRVEALLAGLLTVLSPFYFQVAQEVRTYVFVMLGLTVAAAAILKAEESPQRRRWLALSLVAAAVAQWGHYTAWLILGPLGIYVVGFSGLPARAKAIWTAGVAAAGLVWVPLLLEQWRVGHNAWLTVYGNLTLGHLGDVFGGPFSGRIFTPVSRAVLGAGIVLAAAAMALLSGRTRRVRLLVTLALVPASALLLATLLGHPALQPRYVAVAVPFMIATIAVALGRLPTGARTVALLGVLAISIVGLVKAELPRGQYRDTRGALRYVRAHYQAGELVAMVGPGWVEFLRDYYAARLLPPGAPVAVLGPGPPRALRAARAIRAAVRAHRPIWFVNYSEPYSPAPPPGYAPTLRRLFPAVGWIEVRRVAPRGQ